MGIWGAHIHTHQHAHREPACNHATHKHEGSEISFQVRLSVAFLCVWVRECVCVCHSHAAVGPLRDG